MIHPKSNAEIERLRRAGALVGDVLAELRQMARPGVRLRALNRHAEKMIRDRGGVPAFRGYQGFPATLCLSVNEEALHGLPRWRKLESGDLLSIDCGVLLDGMYGDSAITVAVGEASQERLRLVETTQKALHAGIASCQIGAHLGDVGAAIEAVLNEAGVGLVRSYCGHGIGAALHEDPQVPNWGPAGEGPIIEAGWCLALEPVVTLGGGHVVTRSDGWTIATADGSASAHCELMVACEPAGPRILSLTSAGELP